MKKVPMTLGIVLLLWAARPATATIVILDDYYASSANAVSNFYGSDSDAQQGEDPVGASAQVQGPLANSVAWANAQLLAVAAGAGATAIQPPDGLTLSLSLSTAANVVFTVQSDTPWTFSVEASSSTVHVGNANTQAAAAAAVLDAQGNMLFLYNLSVDGPVAACDFGPGEYKLGLVATSAAAASACPQAPEPAGAESTVEMGVELTPIPEPATIALLGLGTLVFLKKRN